MTDRKPGLCILALLAIGAGAYARDGWSGAAAVAATFLVVVMVIETYLRR